MKKSYFDRPMSDAIKGVALILMFVHHFFTFPDYYIQNPTFLILGSVRTALCGPTRICVSVFAFLTGYFYCLGSRKTYGYSLKKIGNFLVSYWLVYLPFLLLAVGLGCYSLGTGALLGAFGLDSEVMTFCWYVYFYCAAMLLLPLTERLSTGSLWRDALLLGVLPLMAVTAIREALPDNVAGALAAVVQEWYPCVHVGWLMCRYDIFEEIQESTGGATSVHVEKLHPVVHNGLPGVPGQGGLPQGQHCEGFFPGLLAGYSAEYGCILCTHISVVPEAPAGLALRHPTVPAPGGDRSGVHGHVVFPLPVFQLLRRVHPAPAVLAEACGAGAPVGAAAVLHRRKACWLFQKTTGSEMNDGVDG